MIGPGGACSVTLVRLRRFSVQGFKNLEQPIVLDDLGPINVLHGANNVGKSNLLQAIELFFRCVALGVSQPEFSLNPQNLPGFPEPRFLFHLERPAPIRLSAIIATQPDEIQVDGFYELITEATIDITITLKPDGLIKCEMKYVSLGEKKVRVGEDRLGNFLSQLVWRSGVSATAPRFALVGVRRDLEQDPVLYGGASAPLAQEMYSCRDSLDRGKRNRWRSFVRAMEELKEITGDGVFEVIRPQTQASLVFDTEGMRIPLTLLGSGVQQIASLLGNALVRNASIVGIEEPELNLRWDLQNKLRSALASIVSEPHGSGGVDQLFITSHSPAFETSDSFWLMEAGPKGPSLSRRPASELPLVLGSAPQHLGLPERAPQAYVTSQGVIRLPPEVLARLRLDKGGGVVFVDTEPRGVRILSNDEYLDELGLVDDAGQADAEH